MIIITATAATVADWLDPLLESLVPGEDLPTPRVQITVEPGRLTAAIENSQVTSSMSTDDVFSERVDDDTATPTVFTIHGDYLLEVADELGDAVRQALDATIRATDQWFAIESPGPYDLENEIPASCDMTPTAAAFAAA